MKQILITLVLVTSIQILCIDTQPDNSARFLLTGDEIREAVRDLTPEERGLLEIFLKDKLHSANSTDNQEYFEYLLHHFYKGMFDLVLIELKSLGENPQAILHTTGLREDLLLGRLEKTPWFMQAIASLPSQIFESNKDKIVYLESLLDAFRRAHYTPEITQAIDALFMLAQEFFSCKNDVPAVFLSRLIQDLDEIEALINYYQSQR